MLGRLVLFLSTVAASFCVLASPAIAGFGFLPGSAGFDVEATNADGSIDTQAGSHPFELTTSFRLNATVDSLGKTIPDGGDLKDARVDLPAGLVGSATAVPQCSSELLTTLNAERRASCSDASQVGLVGLTLSNSPTADYYPLYNITPPPGTPAEFAFDVDGVPVRLLPSIRTGSDYGISVESSDTTQVVSTYAVTVTFWGVPAASSHDGMRGTCLGNGGESCPTGVSPVPLLTLPTSCTGPLTTTIRADSWQEPIANLEQWASDTSVSHNRAGSSVGMDGCNKLNFEPLITVSPDTSQADTPTGLTVDVKPSLAGLLDGNGLSSADIKKTTVTLPAGVAINPGQAAGLQACQSSQENIGKEEAPACPLASRVGTDEIETPLLKDTLKGNVYVLAQSNGQPGEPLNLQSNPPTLQLLVAASADGVNVKVVGDVHLDRATGRLTTTFSNVPQVPFSDFRLAFSGGAQAGLVTPVTCGTYTTSADFTPWSTPFHGDAITGDSFAVQSGPGNSPCVSSLPFAPSLIAGSTTDQAGGYTDFSLLLQRGDGQQRVSSLQFKTPAGLLAMISKVPLCGEPQAALGTCSAASQIGHTVVEAGPGPYPLVVPEPGQPPAPIYLTGPYRGAPYGLSIVVPVVAGPFNLGTVVVRAAIDADPRTAQLTITTDPLPSILDGIPADLRTIDTVIDRKGFMFNPTSCSPQSFGGTAFSAEGATAAISSRFQVGSCQSLKFKPDLRVSTAAMTSRKGGASLDVKLVYPTVPLGNNQASQQSNLASVKVDLPKQLPSRLTTLQKACTAAVFDANPAACPPASIVGHATALTPILPGAISGPAFFVSHGGEAFPDLVVVLQGDGVTVDLVGATSVRKAVTSSTFKTIPDAPISSFELTLPEGRYSALTTAYLPAKAHGSLCNTKLTMPTTLTAQDGAVIEQSTRISVAECPKPKKHKRR